MTGAICQLWLCLSLCLSGIQLPAPHVTCVVFVSSHWPTDGSRWATSATAAMLSVWTQSGLSRWCAAGPETTPPSSCSLPWIPDVAAPSAGMRPWTVAGATLPHYYEYIVKCALCWLWLCNNVLKLEIKLYKWGKILMSSNHCTNWEFWSTTHRTVKCRTYVWFDNMCMYKVKSSMRRGGGGGSPSLHWAIGQEIATKCYQIDISGVAILHVLCHGTGVASHREVRVTIGLYLLCSGLITPFYIFF